MPRRAKTPDVPATSPGQGYGVAGEQKAAMQAVPMAGATPAEGAVSPPSGAAPVPETAAAPPAGAVSPAAPAGAPDPMGQAIMAALATPAPGGGLMRPTDRPAEPLLTPAPQNVGRRETPTARILADLARNNGNDPELMQLAEDAARRGY